ncbi:cold-shock protein [Myroides sp. LJL119]
MAESSTKKERYKKKALKKKIKQEKRDLKKTVNNKGKSLEEMFVYVDINGRLTDIPPHLQDRTEKVSTKTFYNGVVTHLNEKGFGFIKEDQTNDSIFFHNSTTNNPVKINDRVLFTKTKTERGFKALQVKKEEI